MKTAPRLEDVAEKITSLAKRRGFVFPSSEIYGGAGATWDFGPLGVELKNNVKAAWWRAMVQLREDIVGRTARSSATRACGRPRSSRTQVRSSCAETAKAFTLELMRRTRSREEWRAKKSTSRVSCPSCGERKVATRR